MATDIKVRDIIETAKELKIDTTNIDQICSWYRVGQKGHLHLDRFCYKMTNFRESTDVKGSLKDIKGKVCTYCFESNLNATQQTAYQNYLFIVKSFKQLDNLDSKINNAINASGALRTLELVSNKVANLTVTEDIYEAVEDLKIKIKEKENSISELQKDSEHDMINYASIQNINRTLDFTDDNSIYSRIFGKSSYTSNYEDLWKVWSQTLTNENSFTASMNAAVKEFNKFNLRKITQLDFTLDDLRNHLKENSELKTIEDALTSLWKDNSTILLKNCIKHWEELVINERDKLSLCIIAINQSADQSDKLVNAIFGYYKLSTNKLGGGIVKVPEVLAKYLLNELNQYSSYRLPASIHELDANDNEETIQTALALWQPERYSRNELANFGNALEAARKL